jgi:flagellar assembly protein FliH
MMSTSPDPWGGVLRAAEAGAATAARFDVDLRSRRTLPEELVNEARAQGHATGYAAGWAQGRQEAQLAAVAAHEQLLADARHAAALQAAAVERAVAALAGAAAELERRTAPVAAELEDAIVAGAFALAQAVLGRELATAESPGRDALARALALAPTGRPVVVRLSRATTPSWSASGSTTRSAGVR